MEPLQTSWVVQTNVEPESTTPVVLREACSGLRLPFHEVSVTPGQQSLPALPDIPGPVVFHGRNTLISRALEHPTWKRGVFFSPENFRYDAYVAHYGSAMLNADARVMSLGELVAADYQANAKLFVRPVHDSKVFTGRVVRFSDCAELHREWQRSSLSHQEIPVVVAVVQEIDAEWRVFVVNGNVTGGSMYRPTAERTLPAELVSFAERAAQGWTPAPVFVMDLARVNHSWRIVECNCFNGSRFYEADVTAVVAAVSSYQSQRW
jgi:hypothetical protein